MASQLTRLRKIINHVAVGDEYDNHPLNSAHCMNQYNNESVILNSYPSGDILPDNFTLKKESLSALNLNDGDILVEIKCISIDAYLRTTMYKKSLLHEAVPLGNKMHSLAIAEIIESKNRHYTVGEYVYGGFPVEKYAVISSKALLEGKVEKIQSPSNDKNDVMYYLTYLGYATGCSAYVGVHYVSKPVHDGDIVVVNAASGAVGSIVCQLYRNKGAKVIGITGGQYKKEYLLNILGLYRCIDYKTEDINKKLSEYAPNGFDIAFDNVGGKQLDILLNHLNSKAQIVLCGAVSQYSDGLANDNVYGPKNYLNIVSKNGEMKGFTMFAYFHKLAEIRADLLRMVKNKTLVIKEVPIYGLNNFAVAMTKLMKGDKNGKILLYP